MFYIALFLAILAYGFLKWLSSRMSYLLASTGLTFLWFPNMMEIGKYLLLLAIVIFIIELVLTRSKLLYGNKRRGGGGASRRA